ncbi:SapC family protein [Chitinimonas sp.]|uniref:SapC family protein n=1 Tax=Chitinimonas sp. TaxID=1934313 RepID=UPI0035B188CB
MYQEVKPLHPAEHGELKLKQVDNYGFASQAHAVPVVGPEFGDVSREYVIAFAQTGENDYAALAMLGFRQQENLFVAADGKWDARYVPVFLRRYPFITSEVEGGDAIVCIDEVGARDLSSPDGMPLFENGQPTDSTKQMAEILFRLRDDANRDKVWIKEIVDAGLLKSVSASAELPGGETVNMDGMFVIDEDKLREIPADKAADWLKRGLLSLVYAHLFSLGNLNALSERLVKRNSN